MCLFHTFEESLTFLEMKKEETFDSLVAFTILKSKLYN